MTPHLFGRWRISLLLGIIVLTVIGYLLFSLWGGWDQVTLALKQVGFGAFIPMGLACVAYLLRFARWTRFLNLLGHYLPWKESLRIYIGGFAFSVTPGKTGEALRSVFLKDYAVPYRESFGAFLAERFSDFMAVFLLAMSGLFCCPQTRPMLFVGFAFVSLILFLIQRKTLLQQLERGIKKFLPERFGQHVEFILDTVLSFRKCFSTSTLLLGIFLGMLAWGLEGLGFYTLLQLLNANITLFNAIFIYAFALLVGALTFLPAGLGGAELTMVQLLILYDVPPSSAVAATLLIRLTTLWFSVLLGIIFLPRSLLTTR